MEGFGVVPRGNQPKDNLSVKEGKMPHSQKPAPEGATLREFNLEPHPRILPMLGEINLPPWACIAELVDNAIDSFISQRRASDLWKEGEVHVSLPMVDRPDSRITVRDNGGGMNADTLENAVRAGWSGNDPIGNLGLFGMGFNIATARLGYLTHVWSTRSGDKEWYGLEIDFEKLIRQKNYRTPMKTRPKHERRDSGTEVVIERLKPDQREWFAVSRNRTAITRELARVYSAMLQPKGLPIPLRLELNASPVRGRTHCLWSSERVVDTSRFGDVSPLQVIDRRLEDRPFCKRCWQWLPAKEEACSSCGLNDEVVSRSRKIRGWLGVQRYLHERDFGIDFLRHGRKIEVGNKELFLWATDSGEEKEYPIDDPRSRGRLVGEIHLDHCRVTYTKDRFDRADPGWSEMLEAVRGTGPLRPDKAVQGGYGENASALFKLFQAFRRSNPKNKNAGGWRKLLVVPNNDRALEMAERFFEGDPDYLNDERWWALVEEADRRVVAGPTDSTGAGKADDFWDTGETTAEGADEPAARDTRPRIRTALPSLTQKYRDAETGRVWEVSAFEVPRGDAALQEDGWRLLMTSAGKWEYLVDRSHPVFRSFTLTPMDALLGELTALARDSVRANADAPSFARILTGLRARYAIESRLEPLELSADAATVLSGIAKSLTRIHSEAELANLFGDLSSAEQGMVLEGMAARDVRNVPKMIGSGRFLEFAPKHVIRTFFEKHPELFFDARYWGVPYATLDFGRDELNENTRKSLVQYYSSLLFDLVWLSGLDPTDLLNASRTRLLRCALAIDLLNAEVAESVEA